jgi:hypothetical protein
MSQRAVIRRGEPGARGFDDAVLGCVGSSASGQPKHEGSDGIQLNLQCASADNPGRNIELVKDGLRTDFVEGTARADQIQRSRRGVDVQHRGRGLADAGGRPRTATLQSAQRLAQVHRRDRRPAGADATQRAQRFVACPGVPAIGDNAAEALFVAGVAIVTDE